MPCSVSRHRGPRSPPSGRSPVGSLSITEPIVALLYKMARDDQRSPRRDPQLSSSASPCVGATPNAHRARNPLQVMQVIPDSGPGTPFRSSSLARLQGRQCLHADEVTPGEVGGGGRALMAAVPTGVPGVRRSSGPGRGCCPERRRVGSSVCGDRRSACGVAA